RYDTGDYEQVDPILGDASDFIHLARSAKRRGMELILDGVFSHTGIDSKYFNRFERYDAVGAYQSVASPYFDWYDFTDYPDQYAAWWGIYTLPAVRKENPAYQRFLLDAGTGVLPQWVQRGACGWRLDVVDELPMPLVCAMRKAIKHERADAALIGEVWEDASNKISYGALRSYCFGDSLDSVMNYPLRRAVIDFLTGVCGAGALARVILHQREVYPTPFYYSLMNLLGSHDRVRILNALSGYDRVGAIQLPREEAKKIRLSEAQLEDSKARYLLALKLLCALPGAPTVYYGDEMGMQGMADPWNRAPMAWDRGDAVHWHEVCTLLNHRRTTPVLQTGYLDIQVQDDDTLVIRRYFQNGLDVFGESQRGAEETTTICRRGSS
ncbi:MAG: hypothetical protein EOM69_04010, partial [Clostridia bacterium]|nr:hypothetical protein [Clostridia bacterium]